MAVRVTARVTAPEYKTVKEMREFYPEMLAKDMHNYLFHSAKLGRIHRRTGEQGIYEYNWAEVQKWHDHDFSRPRRIYGR